MKEKVLVTGGTGFTGGHVCRGLIERGYPVRAVVRDAARAEHLARIGCEVVVGDLRDRASLDRATAGIHTVYHIAALYRQENVSRKDMWDINTHGTRNILDASIQAEVKRFVHCSTVGVHGEIKRPPADENAPYGPGDYYQDSKTEGEKIAIEYMQAGRLPISIFRPGGIYGPGDLRFLKLFKSVKKRRFVMFGSGEVLYQLVYIDDLVNGIILCGTKPEAVGNIYILTGEKPITLNQMVSAIAETVGAPQPKLRFPVTPLYLAGFACEIVCKPFGIDPPIYRRRVDFFRKDRAFTISKAQRELGFTPNVDLMAGLRRTAAWYQEQGYI